MLLDLVSCFPGSRSEDRGGDSLRSFYSFRMIVRYFGILLRFGQDFLQSIEGKSDRADPHGSSIAPAIIGRAVRRACPLMEKTTIPGIGVTEIIGFHHSYVISVGQD